MFAINLDIVFFCVESMNNSKPHSRYVRWILAMGVILVGFAILYTDSWRGDSPIELGLSLGLGLVRH